MAANNSGKQPNDMLKVLTPAVALVLIAFTAAYLWMNPAPPSQIRIASGPPDGAYYLFAQRYRELLGQQKIELLVETSAGSLENIQRLGAAPGSPDGVDLALVQGGTADAQRVAAAFNLILSGDNVEAILVNIFGGIVRCDLIAEGIVGAVKEVGVKVPIVVSMTGTNEEEARQMLALKGGDQVNF